MDKNRLVELLNAPANSIIIFTHLDMILWGQAIHFHAQIQTADDDLLTFEMRFLDCREMRWQIYTHMQETDAANFPQTELVNFRMGRDQHRSPAHLLTEHFGLSLFYGKLELVTQNGIVQLE